MAPSDELLQPLSEGLRSDLVLLSSYLARQQHAPSQAHPRNNNLALVSSLSCLLTIGNKKNPKALNVNAVAGRFSETVTETGTTNTLKYIVCAENGRQHAAMVNSYRRDFRKTRNVSAQKNENTERTNVVPQSVKEPFFLEEPLFSEEALESSLLEEALRSEEALLSEEVFFYEDSGSSEEGFFSEEGLHLEDSEEVWSSDDASSVEEPVFMKEHFSADTLSPNRDNGHVLLDGWNPANLKGSKINKLACYFFM